MKPYIQVTRFQKGTGDFRKIIVLVGQITYIDQEPNRSIIHFSGGKSLEVTEAYYEILKLLDGASKDEAVSA